MAVTNPIQSAQSVAAAANDIRDIKPPVDLPDPWLWVWLGLGILALAGLIAAALISWLKLRRQPVLVPVIPPHERARRKLEAALDLYDQPKPFCILVSDAVRLYLEERFNLRAPDRTTEEFLIELKRSPSLTSPQKASLEQFLSACDLVKFARFEPGRPELEGLYASALRLIEETEPKPAPADADHALHGAQHESKAA